MSQTRNQDDAGRKQSQHWLTFSGLCGIISQKIDLFITTAVRTTSPTDQSTELKFIKFVACYLLHAGCLLGLFFDSEGGGDMVL
jgi:predicted lipase